MNAPAYSIEDEEIRARRAKRKSDFYSMNFSSYYICKDKEELKQKQKNKIFQKKFSFSKLFSILIIEGKEKKRTAESGKNFN